MAERKKGTKPERGAAESATEAKTSKEAPAKRKAEAKSAGGSAKAAQKAGTKAGGAKPKAGTKAKAAPKEKTEAKPKAAPKKAAGKDKKPAKPKAKPKTAAKPKGAPKRAAEKAAPAPMTVHATARFVRVAPRKARHLADQIRGLHIDDARSLLRFSPRDAARDVSKLLDSAAANAENNHDLIADELMVTDVRVDEGPTLRRYQPRALGRATKIDKRTSHISLALTPEDED